MLQNGTATAALRAANYFVVGTRAAVGHYQITRGPPLKAQEGFSHIFFCRLIFGKLNRPPRTFGKVLAECRSNHFVYRTIQGVSIAREWMRWRQTNAVSEFPVVQYRATPALPSYAID